MPRTAATPAQREQTRQKIRQAAAAIYSDGGLSAVSARAIATRAEVSVGTLYSYYSNLGDLLRSLWTTPVAQALQHMRGIAESEVSPLQRLQALLAYYVDFARANSEVYRGAFLFVRPEGAPQGERPPIVPDDFHLLLCGVIREGQKAGDIKKSDSDRLAHLLWAGVHGAIALPINFDSMEFGAESDLPDDMIAALMNTIKA